MAYTRPTLTSLIATLRTDFRTAFVNAGRPLEAFVRNTVPWVLTRVWGDAIHNLYGLLEYATRQILPTTADTEWLEQHGATIGIARLPASPATGRIRMAGLSGTTVPSGTAWVRGDGLQYLTTAPGVTSGGAVTVDAVCVTPGIGGNTGIGGALTLVTPIAGITGGTFAAGLGGWANGVDIETDEGLRERILFDLQRPPQGGAAIDYERWARLVPGVTRVWVMPEGRGAGTVDVYFLHSGGSGIGIPGGGQIAEVQAILDANRPVTAWVLAKAPTPVPVAFTLRIDPDTSDNRTLIETELDSLFLALAGSANIIYLSDYWGALTGAIGPTLTSVDMTAPVGPTTLMVGQVATRGTITWL